jgi:hypothetical protein
MSGLELRDVSRECVPHMAESLEQPPQQASPATRVAWEELVAESRGGVAYYHPTISMQEQETLEKRCVEIDSTGQLIHGRLLSETNSKCCFWIRADTIIGVSEGEETCYIHVEWASGTIHGRPITPAELKKKGAEL